MRGFLSNFYWCFYPKQLWTINSYIHTPKSTTQGDTQLIRSTQLGGARDRTSNLLVASQIALPSELLPPTCRYLVHPTMLKPGGCSQWTPPGEDGVTLLEHWRTVLMSSWITMSTHFTHGSFSFTTCFFTMASKAMSGVNRPVLQPATHTRAGQQCKTFIAPIVIINIHRAIIIAICYMYWSFISSSRRYKPMLTCTAVREYRLMSTTQRCVVVSLQFSFGYQLSERVEAYLSYWIWRIRNLFQNMAVLNNAQQLFITPSAATALCYTILWSVQRGLLLSASQRGPGDF